MRILKTKKEKEKFYEGIKAASDVIASTLGSAGKTVIISRGHMTDPLVTKDGVSVSQNLINLEDEVANVGAMFCYNASRKTVADAGDGTTSTALLLNAIVSEGIKKINSGAKPQFVKQGIDIAVKAVVAQLKIMSEDIGEDNNKILNVATISANNDIAIGQLIADAYKQIGNKGMLTIEKSATVETYTKIVAGFEFNRGYIDPYYINVPEKRITVLDNPQIFITDYTISSVKDLNDISETFDKVIQSGRPLMIICTDTDQIAHATFLQNKIKGGLKICVVKATNTYKSELLADIAVLTGGTVISDVMGLKLKHLKVEHLGKCEKIIVTDKTTTIINGEGEPINIIRRKEEITTMINTTEDVELKKVHEKRLAQVSGSVGVLYVGASTDVECKEKFDRTDDAVRAVKSAIEEGIVAGGGIALLRCIEAVEKLNVYSNYYDNIDVLVGINIIKKVLEAPLRQMIKNAGVYQKPLTKIWSKVFRTSEEESILKQIKASVGNIGYNVKTSAIEDLKKNGIIDPAKVCRVSLENAASVAGTILTSEYILVELKQK